MQYKMLRTIFRNTALAGILLSAAGVQAADVYLRAQAFNKTLSTTESVPMWGFASCTDATFTSCSDPSATQSPGPQITLLTTDSLSIHLQNSLSLPVSIVIPGQGGGGNPVMMTDTLGRSRVQSFTAEAAPGSTTATVYTWNSLKPGTYLYQSGTHSSIQVPMGLYGSLIVRQGPGYSSIVSADGPSHYYRLGDSSTGSAIDLGSTTSNGNYGIGVSQGTLGYITDEASEFDSNDNNSFIDTNVTALSQNTFSIEAWVNANSTNGPNRIVAKDEIGIQGQFILWFQNGKLRFHVYPQGGSGGSAWVIAEAPITPPSGTTFHVVGVFDGTDVILYVDGAEVARTPLGATTTNTNTLPITIGADSDNISARGHIFDGNIDEVAIYDSVLSAVQIQSHFDANNAEAVVLFSEVDPLQNTRVAAAEELAQPLTTSCIPLVEYALIPVTGYPCTIDYNPVVSMVNGEFSTSLRLGNPGGSAILRLLNAGLRSRSPSLVGLEMSLVAEDGNPYPGLPRQQSAVLLAAGKTLDALVTMPLYETDGVTIANSSIGLYDHMPAFNNSTQPDDGALVSLQVGAGAAPETTTAATFEESYNVTEDTQLVIDPTGGNGVSLVSEPSNGSIAVIPNTSTTPLLFEYMPNPDFSGTDFFIYRRNNGNTYNVTLNVTFVNDSPVAANDSYKNTMSPGITISAPGVLGNDSDLDGDTLTAIIEGTGPSGLVLNSDGSFSYSGNSTTFSYRAMDEDLTSEPVVVTLNVNPVPNITLVVQDPAGNAVTNFRWVVEEDTMWHPNPDAPPPINTLATSFHKSYMPIVAQGNDATDFSQLALDPTKHYYVSVLPDDAASGSGHTIGGAQIPPGSTIVTVNVNNQPIPYAQISMIVFEDSSPTNGAIDGAEKDRGLGGFQVTVEDAGGRYGISAGTMMQDADGIPLTNALDCFGGSPAPLGVILTCPDTQANRDAGLVGQVLIKNLFPGKYGIITTPPAGQDTWIQTSTIEGTKVIDAWVKAGEPAFFQEFGPGGWHVFVGFVNPDKLILPVDGTSNTVTGKVTNLHMSRPPNQQLVDSNSYDSLAHTRAWVGINSAGGTGPNFAVVKAEEDGTFSIPNIPNGEYQLVIWDSYLDQVIAYRGVSLPDGADVGNVPVFQWFARSEHNVFLDENENGIRDPGEVPIPEQAVNLRWRDGTVNQSFPTDLEGFVPFDQTFPFFHWQVLEIDYTRFKATGLTVTVDGGGDVSTGPYPGILSPQQQGPCTENDVNNNFNGCTIIGAPYSNPNQRTETGAVLTQGFQGFLGQTSVFDWGKKPYQSGENGGISGIVYYSSTRAENDPRIAVGEPWEPGIPSVKIRLYREVQTINGGTELALIKETETDNWDQSLPTGCPGSDSTDQVITGGPADKCYDGLRNFNQARPAVFDGGYAFNDIPSGKYIVEMIPPTGYELLKEEDNNVSYGDVFANVPVAVVLPNGAALFAIIPDPATVVESLSPEPGIAQPRCVGTERTVPDILSLFPNENAEAPFAGSLRPLCDRKEVILSDQGQAAADFFLFTGAPIAAHFAGMILDDVAQEFSIFSPQFGEKWAPPFVPVSIQDFHGKEISRVYSDQWGRMNGLVPSTFTANMPSPSGFSPAMLITCMNDPGPIIDTRVGSPTNGQSIVDPQYNPAYSNFCYTFQYMPGTTTYLDTPVLPVSAFASGYNPPQCSLDEGTPMIRQVDGTGLGPLVIPGNTIRISSMGNAMEVPNPAYEGPLGSGLAAVKTISKDYSFGENEGIVILAGEQLTVTSWSEDVIEVTAPATEVTGELVVTRDNGNSTEHSITVTVSNEDPIRVTAGSSIQTAIDAASPGALILVEPGTYNELVIMWKPVRLQGAGAGSTLINAVKSPTEVLEGWRAKMDCLFGIGPAGCTDRVDTLPTQPEGAIGFESEEGAAITVVGVLDSGQRPRPANSFLRRRNVSRIDGFSITGGDTGGGIFVNGYAHRLEISNNHVFGNNGLYGGGIRIGRPFLELPNEGPFDFNRRVNIHNNSITQNGGLGGAGGGLSILTGTDRYKVSDNFVCGNFTTGDGGGIGHLGLSHRGEISNNRILFNQSFSQATTRSGGGLFISGETAGGGGLTHGSGSVNVESNLIQGNHAGAGHGGGIRTQFINGRDIANTANPNNGRIRPGRWNTIRLVNNMIVNNVAGWSGAGVSMQDTARSFITNNTIVHNDSTATVSATFTTPDPNISANQIAGISTEPHTTGLNNEIPNAGNTRRYRDFSNPNMTNNIIWQNRSFHYDGTLVDGAALFPSLSQTSVGECVSTTNYSDLGVLGSGGFVLNPRFSVLTDAAGFHTSNTSNDPQLVNDYCNGGRGLVNAPETMMALPALDEGGATWIDVRYGPLTRTNPNTADNWDYHIGENSSAIDSGTAVRAPNVDFDNDDRPIGNGFDIGADESGIARELGGIVSYSSGDFGDVQLNQASTVTITATVSEAQVSFYSSTNPASPFVKTGDTCTGTTVAIGDSCSYTITYTPTTVGENSSSFRVENNNSAGSPETISVAGVGFIPPGTVEFTSVTPFVLDRNNNRLFFGRVEDGNVEATVTITVRDFPVTFGNLRVNGGRYRKSTEDDADSCSGMTLTSGNTCTVTIVFNANGNRWRNGRLIVPSNGVTNTKRLRLRGR